MSSITTTRPAGTGATLRPSIDIAHQVGTPCERRIPDALDYVRLFQRQRLRAVAATSLLLTQDPVDSLQQLEDAGVGVVRAGRLARRAQKVQAERPEWRQEPGEVVDALVGGLEELHGRVGRAIASSRRHLLLALWRATSPLRLLRARTGAEGARMWACGIGSNQAGAAPALTDVVAATIGDRHDNGRMIRVGRRMSIAAQIGGRGIGGRGIGGPGLDGLALGRPGLDGPEPDDPGVAAEDVATMLDGALTLLGGLATGATIGPRVAVAAGAVWHLDGMAPLGQRARKLDRRTAEAHLLASHGAEVAWLLLTAGVADEGGVDGDRRAVLLGDGTVALLDGASAPCTSLADRPELRSFAALDLPEDRILYRVRGVGVRARRSLALRRTVRWPSRSPMTAREIGDRLRSEPHALDGTCPHAGDGVDVVYFNIHSAWGEELRYSIRSLEGELHRARPGPHRG